MGNLVNERSSSNRDCRAQRGGDSETAWRLQIERVSICKPLRKARALPPSRALFTAALCLIGLVSASQAQSLPPAPAEGAITTAIRAHSLSREEAVKARPVHLRGVVTYFDPDFGTGYAAVFLHDGTGGVYILPTVKEGAPLFAGALVDVQGVTAPGGFGSIVANPRIRVLGRSPLPPHPPRVSLAILKTGAEDAQWVEAEGSIHRVTELPRMVVLHLEMADGPVPVILPRDPGSRIQAWWTLRSASMPTPPPR